MTISFKNYKFLLQPTKEQEETLMEWQYHQRWLWNSCVQISKESYRLYKTFGSKINLEEYIGYSKVAELRQHYQEFKDVPSSLQRELVQAFLKYIKIAFKNKKGFPRFKGKSQWVMMKSEQPQAFRVVKNGVHLPKLGKVKAIIHRSIPKNTRSFSILKENDKWYIVISAKVDIHKPSSIQNRSIGIDVGAKKDRTNAIVDSDGTKFPAPLFLDEKKYRHLQRHLAKKKKGSYNRLKVKERLSKFSLQNRRRRLDWHHKMSTYYASTYEVIKVENLRINNMTKSAKGSIEAPGVNVQQKSSLNKQMLDKGIATFFSMLDNKTTSYGTTFMKVDPKYTSQKCNKCSYISKENRITRDEFECSKCGHQADADINAAKNIRDLDASSTLSKNTSKTITPMVVLENDSTTK